MATLGIDIGCISVKIAVVGTPEDRDSFQALPEQTSRCSTTPMHDDTVLPDPDAPPVLATAYRRIKGSPTEATRELLDPGAGRAARGHRSPRCASPAPAAAWWARMLDIPYENEFKAIARAIGALHPDVTTVFEMGGETSKFIHLETDAGLRPGGHRRLRHQRRLRRRHRLVHGPAGQPPALRHRGRGRHRRGAPARPPPSPGAARSSPSRT